MGFGTHWWLPAGGSEVVDCTYRREAVEKHISGSSTKERPDIEDIAAISTYTQHI